MINVFISYAREDALVAKELFALIKRNGYIPWLDKENIIPGKDWEREIERAVLQSHVQIFLCSPRSVSKRGFFQKEVRLALKQAQLALEGDVSILPYIVEECEVPEVLRKYHWVDAREDDVETMLLKALSEAARQRGLLVEDRLKAPIVSKIVQSDELVADGRLQYAYKVPQLLLPPGETSSETVNAIIAGQLYNSLYRARGRILENDIPDKPPNEYFTTTAVEFLCERFVSLRVNTYVYSGGAHGNYYTEAFCVDFQGGTIFSPANVFVETSAIVEKLIEFVRQQEYPPLIEWSELSVVMGAALETKAYFADDGLHVCFDPYDVFFYAFGGFEIVISYHEPAFSRVALSSLGVEILGSILKQA